MWLYSDFIEVNQRYYEFFSEDADRADATYWKSFIPHEAMISLLNGLLRALEGTGKKSLWIHGAYGTGKTHAQFVLKHLLEAPWDEVADYFNAHGLGQDLLKRLEGLRTRGRGLVIYRASASSVDSPRRLMVELQVAVKKALAAQGFEDSVTPTLYDQVLARLTGADQVFDWPRAFEKHRAEFADFTSSQAVVDALLAKGDLEGRLKLMGRVARLLDSEGFYLLDDPAAIKEWLRGVIAHNRLSWLVFIWDEFTDFFLNVQGLAGLQELAHLSTEAPFYLVLTTHRSPELLQQFYGGRGEDWRKLLDRFDKYAYNMEPVTAYRLLRNAIRAKSGKEEPWQREQEALWDGVKLGTKPFLGENDRLADLQALVPLHPYAAYLLSQIARQFSSSQRTLFRFLRQGDHGSLATFLGTHPSADWKWYTAEGLWDYFFGTEGFELPAGFREVVSYYGSRKGALHDADEHRAFRATMLLIGLGREIAGVAALQPTLGNLRAVFSGTPLGGKIDSIMDNLCQTDLVHPIRQGADRQYIIPLGNVDREAIKRYRAEFRFESEVQAVSRSGSLGWAAQQLYGDVGEMLKRRLALTLVSAEELERRRERVAPSTKAFQLGVVVVLCCDDGERTRALDQLQRIPSTDPPTAYVLPESPVSRQRWDEWCEERALARWYKENGDAQNAQYHETTANNKLADWLKLLRAGLMQVFYAIGPTEPASPQSASGQEGYIHALENIVARRYTWRPELICPTATVHRENYGPKGAEIGLGVGSTASPYNVLVDYLQRQGLWPSAGDSLASICAARPENPLAQLQFQVAASFAEQDSVSLNDLWEQLQKPPFGFFPSPLAITLLGVTLRDYVDGYYWRDGINTRPLERGKLASLIDAVMRNKQNVTLTRSTPEARSFCAILVDAFALNPEESKYPQNARDALRTLLTTVGYPLWALHYASEQPIQSLTLLQAPLADRTDDQVELTNERLAAIVPTLIAERARLTEIVQRKPFEAGMRYFITSRAPSLLNVAERLKISLPSLMVRLRSLLQQETWLWQEDAVAERLPALHADLELTAALSELLGKQDNDLDSALGSFRAQLQEGKLPLFVLAQGAPELVQTTLTGIDRLLKKEPLTPTEKLGVASSLEQERNGVRVALRDHVQALCAWVATNLGAAVTPEEAEQMLAMPPIFDQAVTPTSFRAQVEQRLRDMAKRKLITEIKDTWQEITGSSSPEEWSRKHGMPLHWVLEGSEFTDLFGLLRAPQTRTEQDLRAALSLMQQQKSRIEAINDTGLTEKTLLVAVLGPYSELVQTPEDLADLKEHLLRAFPQVHEWKRETVGGIAKKWLHRVYQERFYAQVVHRVELMPEAEIKELLKELSRDPFVGMRLLQRRRKS